MARSPSIKSRLRDGHPVIGCWLWLFNPMSAEIMVQAGYDFVMIDREHGPGALLDSVPVLQVADGNACAGMMRLPSNDPVEVKRALDLGVKGVMIPNVNTRAEAEAVVEACRYPPDGQRGMAAVVIRGSGYGVGWREYIRDIDDELLIMCQIESRQAVENIEEIAAVEGVDLLFVGPFDLSANLGFLGQPDHPEVRAQIDKVERAALTAGKALGCIATPERGEAALIRAGYRFLICDGDIVLLRDAARASVARQREIIGGA